MKTSIAYQVKSWHIIAFISCLIGYLYFFNVPPRNNGPEYLFWGYLHILLHGSSIYLYFRKSHVKTSYPFIVLFSFFQLIAFGIPVFLINKSKFLFTAVTVESLEYSFYAYFVIYCFYWIGSLVLWKRLKPFQAIPEIPIRKMRIILLCSLVLVGMDYLKLVPQLSQFISITKNFYLGLMILYIVRKQVGLWEKVAFGTVLLAELATRMVSGLIAEVAFLILFLIVVMYICSIRLTFLLPVIIPFFLFYMVFSKVKFTYRQMTWFGREKYTVTEKLALIYELSQREGLKTKKVDKQGGDNFFHRYSYPSSIFSLTLRRTPAIVPYWEGVTYYPLFTKFIPRLFWPEKPKESLGHDFGVKYGIIRKSDGVTSINTPILVEMYINFGLNGLYIGSAMFGLLLLFIDRYLNSNAISLENKILNAGITFLLIIIENNFSLIFGNIFLFCIVMYYIFRFVRKK